MKPPYDGPMVCVDPGLEFGFAVFGKGENVPNRTGVYTPPRRVETWEGRLVHSCRATEQLMDAAGRELGKDCRVLVELPAYFASKGGTTVAKGGALVKLSITVGAVFYAATELGMQVDLIPVADWKGQLKKPVVVDRIWAYYCSKAAPPVALENMQKNIKSHALDAVGIGLWARGLINQ